MKKSNSPDDRITIKEMLRYCEHNKDFDLKLISVENNKNRDLHTKGINRPGLNLFGFYEYFAYQRIQIFGKGEFAYLEKINLENKLHSIKHYFSFDIPCIIFSHGQIPMPEFIEMAKTNQIPILISKLDTSKLTEKIYTFFNECIFQKEIISGVMMEIFGIGVLIKGNRGIGKSECCLELIERGHRFIADETVNIRLLKGSELLAYSSNVISYHMNINGIGIINIAHLFGVGSILKNKSLDLIINLEYFKQSEEYNIIEKQNLHEEILKVKVPLINLPIRKGSNLPILIETAVMNQRLKMSGYDTAKEFNKKIFKLASRRNKTNDNH